MGWDGMGSGPCDWSLLMGSDFKLHIYECEKLSHFRSRVRLSVMNPGTRKDVITKCKAWLAINAQLDQLINACFGIFCVMYLSALSGLVQCTPRCEH